MKHTNPQTDKSPDATELWIRIPMAVWKRYAEVGEAMCLYGHLISWTTTEIPDPDNPGKKLGIVHGGEPQSDKRMADEIGCHRNTVLAHRETLLAAGLLLQVRGPYGHRLAIRCSDKWSAKRQGKASNYVWIEKARRTTSCASDAQPTVHQKAPDAQTTVQEMHNIPTRDAQPTVQRSTASCASDRRNPNESQELRSRKPRKAYRKQRQSLGAQNQNRAPSSFSSTHPVADATIGQDESPVNEQLLTERQVKRLASKIAARCMSLNVTLSEKGMDTLRNELAEAPIFDDDIWLYAAGEIIDTLSKADNDGFAFKQAGTKVPAMIVPAVVGDGSGTETVVDRYRWHRELPATMARQRAEMQSQVASDMAAIQEENDARDEYEAWVAERGLDDGFEPTNPSIYRRYVLRESLRAGYEVDRAAAQKRLDELRAARQTEQQVTQTVGAQ